MSEVLEIEVDGEIDDDRSFDADQRPSRWGLPIAVGIAGLLLLAVLIVVVVPAATNRQGAASPPGATEENRLDAEAMAAIDDAQGALAGWGRFAVTGDLEQLDRRFATEGPQYRMLANEAERLGAQPPGPPAYTVSLTEAIVVSKTAKEAKVRGDVSWTRIGEAGQQYEWEIALRRAANGRWLLWTVAEWDASP